jgi:Tol biopolymer transport system component
VNLEHRSLVIILAVLTVSVLLTGTLALYLILGRGSQGPSAVAGESRIAFVSAQEEEIAVYRMNTDGSGAERVSRGSPYASGFPSWSPDGERLAYLEGHMETGEGYVCVAAGDEYTRVGDVSRWEFLIRPTWSPDGRLVAFVDEGEPGEDGNPTTVIQIARGDGSGVERRIALPIHVRFVVSLRWSPAGDELLLVGRGTPDRGSYLDVPGVYVMPTDGESMTKLLDAWAADWSPDGEEVVIAEYSSEATIWAVEGDRRPRPLARLEGEGRPVEVAWSSDGAYLAVATTPNHSDITALHVVALETGGVTTVVDGDDVSIGWLDWSADGGSLLFTLMQMGQAGAGNLPPADLWVYDAASGQLEQLTSGEGFEGMGVWSP